MPPKKQINPKYVPKSLTPEDRKKQIRSIRQGKDRPIVKSFTSKLSKHVINFEKKYKRKITDLKFIEKNIISRTGINKIMDRGKAAYFSGSRPNQTPSSWAYSRLASTITNGPARKIDKSIWDEYKIKK